MGPEAYCILQTPGFFIDELNTSRVNYPKLYMFIKFIPTLCIVLALLPKCIANEPTANADLEGWKSQRFDQFDVLSQGTLGNAGTNIYVRHDGSIMPIRSYDYNGSGYADLIFNNTHDHAFEIPVRIFLNKNGLPDPKDVIELPASAGSSVAAVELTDSGYTDIIVGNGYNNTTGHQHSFIYWGGADGWKADRRTGLPTLRAQTISVGDFKNNGKPAVFFGNHGEMPGEKKESFVYWGDGKPFTVGNRTILRTDGALSSAVGKTRAGGYTDLMVGDYEKVAVFFGGNYGLSNDHKLVLGKHVAAAICYADLNGDGFGDLFVGDGASGEAARSGIYYGAKDGLDPDSFVQLPLESVTACAVGDFDKSGQPQIAVATYTDNREKDAELLIFKLNGEKKWEESSRLTLKQMTSLAAADVNDDGYDDLAVAQKWDSASKNIESLLLLGGKLGLKKEQSVSFPTNDASGVAMVDLKKDGKKDLLFANFSSGRSFGDIDSYVYYGGPDFKYSPDRMTKIPVAGAMQSVSGDFNADGISDALLISSGEDDPKNYLNSVSSIFWGSKDGLAPDRKTDLPPGARGFGATVADLNRDGYLDFVLGDMYGKKLRIYYGSQDGYTEKGLHALESSDPFFVRAVDLNGDGLLDLISPHVNENKVVIYWNSPEGFNADWTKEIYHDGPGAPNFADLRNNGSLDMIIAGALNGTTGDFRTYSSIYWSDPEGFSNYNRTVINPNCAVVQIAVADLMNNGILDLVAPGYHGFSTRAVPSYLYWGDGKNFSDCNRTPLETYAASASFIMDLNEDGWPDITFANHNRNNDHRLKAFIYWGSADGYSKDNITELPVIGPHMMSDADPGNLMTRKMVEDYTSPVCEIQAPGSAAALTWESNEPRGSSLVFDVRTGETREEVEDATWIPNVQKGASIEKLAGRKFFQFRCTFKSKTGATQARLISTSLLTK